MSYDNSNVPYDAYDDGELSPAEIRLIEHDAAIADGKPCPHCTKNKADWWDGGDEVRCWAGLEKETGYLTREKKK